MTTEAPPRTVAVTIGVDIGQKVDPTAIAVLSEERTKDAKPSESIFTAHFLDALPLGTGYPEVASRVAQIVAGVCERQVRRPVLLVDITGVGRPVAEMIVAALKKKREDDALRWEFIACTFNHGDRLKVGEWIGPWREATVGKAYLCSRLQSLLQSRRLRLPRTKEAEQLAKELLDYEIKVDVDANDKYGAFKVGSHDDLVTALGLAALMSQHRQRTI